jgi:signal transduction histidine kinase
VRGTALVATVATGLAVTAAFVLSRILGGRFEVAVPALGGACLVSAGIIVLYLSRALRSHERIATQLLALRAHLDLAALEAVPTADDVAAAWNHLVEVVRRRAAIETIEARLRETIGGLKRRESDQVLDSLTDGLAVTAGSLVRFANRAFATLLRIEDRELAGRSIEQFVAIGDRERADLATPDRPVAFETMFGSTPADGVLRITRLPLLGHEGTATHVWTVRDVTNQRLAEAMRDQFVSSATHELRTPLANIKALSEQLATCDDIDVESQKEFCNTIDAEVGRLSRFVDDLLSIDQMESGALALVRHETDVERLIAEVCEHVRPQMESRGISFETALPQKFPKLLLDKDKFAAALVNLLGNAAKYTPPGGKVRLVVERNGEHLRFHVEDTGIGIAADELERVFEKFFRSGDDRVRDVAGNGLGLSFTREVVRLHGGDVTVSSELDKGTRFTVTLAS